MIVVTGASGNVGRPLVEALTSAGEKVVAVSRNTPAHDLPEGARHVSADLAEPDTLRPALDGAEALFVLLAGELLGGGAPATEVLAVARESGVRRVVLLSSQINGTRPDALSHGRLREFEEAVRSSGLDWTVLRPGGFASNAYAWADAVREQRTVITPFADVALPVVDPADIAEVAAVVLREDGHSEQVYELTGPAAVTPREQAAMLAEALGEDVHVVELTREQAREHMAGFMPDPVIDGTLDIIGAPLPAEQRVSTDTESVLGRPAGPFTGWARRNLHAFK
ncbi:SDR family oxidoreductase [Streptomyces bauhiniae]|uniref:SDR family oxidoreductase n=1 Tax=Streptomyces bauhiniae TaxID=2340725 RepID=UPI0034543F55